MNLGEICSLKMLWAHYTATTQNNDTINKIFRLFYCLRLFLCLSKCFNFFSIICLIRTFVLMFHYSHHSRI